MVCSTKSSSCLVGPRRSPLVLRNQPTCSGDSYDHVGVSHPSDGRSARSRSGHLLARGLREDPVFARFLLAREAPPPDLPEGFSAGGTVRFPAGGDRLAGGR